MNIHLLRSDDCSLELYRDVLHLLQQVKGPMIFIESEGEEFDSEGEIHTWENPEEFGRKTMPRMSMDIEHSFTNYAFPREEKRYSWKELFGLCESYRKKQNINKEDHIVLLTSYANEHNWFGSMHETDNNYFIQTSHWGFYFGSDIDRRFPVAYETVAWILRRYMFASIPELKKGLHNEPIGCLMDFCEDKTDIIFKMRTGDVCKKCLDQINKMDLSRSFVSQVFQVIENIRKYMTWKERAFFLKQPTKLTITGRTKRFFLEDAGALEIRLNPMEKLLYLLFLNHPEGIYISHLPDYQEELLDYYEQVNNQDSRDDMKYTIERTLNVLEGHISTNLSRIRRKFRDALGDEVAELYAISGNRGEKFSIKLDREFVESN
jgi:hypothetical protein